MTKSSRERIERRLTKKGKRKKYRAVPSREQGLRSRLSKIDPKHYTTKDQN